MVLLASDFDKSRFLKAADLSGEKKFRIKNVTAEVVGTGDEKEHKLVVWFTNDERGLLLNKTNLRTLRGAFGDNTETWREKIFVIFPTMVDIRGKMVPALRVRIPAPKQAGTAGNGQTAAAPQPPQQASSTPAKSTTKQLDEFGQSQSAERPSVADDLDDEIPFN
jgi:hypothetical protein